MTAMDKELSCKVVPSIPDRSYLIIVSYLYADYLVHLVNKQIIFMKNILILFAMMLGFSLAAQDSQEKQVLPPPGDALVGDVYGEGVPDDALESALSTSELSVQLADADSLENIAVQGVVTDVCPKKGCWISIETENNEKFFVKMKDYGFFVPTALEGKTVVLEGKANYKVVSVKELQHYAEDAQKPQEEIDQITEPETEIRFLANGIRVIEG